MFIAVYGYLLLLCWAFLAIYLLVQTRKISYLRDVKAASDVVYPAIAVVIPVRNEESEVEAALRSVCGLDYPAYRILVINDRSTDSTPVILEKLAATESKITLINIRELPQGWLGKNHALQTGYEQSNEEWLLFTDADVVYSAAAVQKAMDYAIQNKLDHLTILPEVRSRSAIFGAVMNTFALLLDIRLRPWNARKPSSSASVAVGAFNLLKRSAYEKAGTHRPISLRPDDDLKLGERIKAAGLRQDVLYGEDELRLEWYPSLAAFVNGLMKNSYAAANYNLAVAIGSAILAFLVFVMPVPLLLLAGWPHFLIGIAILFFQVILLRFKPGINGRWWHGLVVTFAGAVMVYIILVSTFRTIRQGGIYWRESFYPLSELKKQS